MLLGSFKNDCEKCIKKFNYLEISQLDIVKSIQVDQKLAVNLIM